MPNVQMYQRTVKQCRIAGAHGPRQRALHRDPSAAEACQPCRFTSNAHNLHNYLLLDFFLQTMHYGEVKKRGQK